jgi:4'-phosphopantetheinyl transferase
VYEDEYVYEYEYGRISMPLWRPGDDYFPLADGDVDVWLIDLARPPSRSRSVLTERERARARRYRFSRDSDGFVRGRLALRAILAQVVGCSPGEIEIVGGDGEKPTLPAAQRCFFSFSRSAGYALCAVTRIGPVGIDIEAERPIADFGGVAAEVFGPEELDELQSLSGAEAQAAFFRGWTRKEAYLKALGVGLTRDPRSVRVSLRADERLEVFDASNRRGPRWLLRSFTPMPGFHAALAIGAPAIELRFWHSG